MPSTIQNKHRRLQGVVVSTAMKNTAGVRIDRSVPHPKYGKYHTISKKFLIDDPKNSLHVGDVVIFEECRPISRSKRWRYVSTVKPVV